MGIMENQNQIPDAIDIKLVELVIDFGIRQYMVHIDLAGQGQKLPGDSTPSALLFPEIEQFPFVVRNHVTHSSHPQSTSFHPHLHREK